MFDTKDKAVTVGRDLIIRGGNPLTAAKVYTRSGTFIMTGDSPSIDNGAHLIADGIIVADNSASPAEGFYNLTIAEGAINSYWATMPSCAMVTTTTSTQC